MDQRNKSKTLKAKILRKSKKDVRVHSATQRVGVTSKLTTQFDTSLNELDFQSRSQMYEKVETCLLFSLPRKFLSSFGLDSVCCYDLLVCLSLCNFLQDYYPRERNLPTRF